jgi:hypothetical protein
MCCLYLQPATATATATARSSRARVSSHTSGPESQYPILIWGLRRSYCTLYPVLEIPVRQYVLCVLCVVCTVVVGTWHPKKKTCRSYEFCQLGRKWKESGPRSFVKKKKKKENGDDRSAGRHSRKTLSYAECRYVRAVRRTTVRPLD